MKDAPVFNFSNHAYNRVNSVFFEPVIITDDCRISVQASAAHYCKPKETLSTLNEYVAFEMAIIYKGNLICPIEHSIFKSFEWAEKYGQDTVASYVDMEFVNKVITDIHNLFHKQAEEKKCICGKMNDASSKECWYCLRIL